MLVLSRKTNETIYIDPRQCPVDELGRIAVTVVDIRGDKVRLGVDAPKGIPVHRAEVQKSVDRELAKAVAMLKGEAA